jgi:hypothetical protein
MTLYNYYNKQFIDCGRGGTQVARQDLHEIGDCDPHVQGYPGWPESGLQLHAQVAAHVRVSKTARTSHAA